MCLLNIHKIIACLCKLYQHDNININPCCQYILANIKLSQPVQNALITSPVDEIILFTLVVAEMTFKVNMMASLVVTITCVVAEITF